MFTSLHVVILGMFTSLHVVIVIVRLVGEALGARVVPKWCRFHCSKHDIQSQGTLTARMYQTVHNLSVTRYSHG